MSTELAIIKKENIDMIISNAPSAYEENQVSLTRCTEAGNALLARMQQGMTDELDQQAALYIEKARKTVVKMNQKRSALTKLFDSIRTRFTAMEADADPTKAGSVPNQVQQLRNQYAAKIRAEEQARQREAMLRQQREQARQQYRTACETDYRNSFREYLNFYLEGLRNLFGSVTLDNYEQRMTDIRNASVAFPETDVKFRPNVLQPLNLVSAEDLKEIRTKVLNDLMPGFRDEFERAMTEERQELTDSMPSKRQELQRAAQTSADEAARIKADIQAREAAEAARREQERIQREQQEQLKAKMEASKAAVGDLFDQAQVSKPAYTPKAQVKKKLVPLNAEAFPEIFSLWWTNEGRSMTVEELTKKFKTQITYCEKLANKEGTLIQSEHIYYEDDVKAK